MMNQHGYGVLFTLAAVHAPLSAAQNALSQPKATGTPVPATTTRTNGRKGPWHSEGLPLEGTFALENDVHRLHILCSVDGLDVDGAGAVAGWSLSPESSLSTVPSTSHPGLRPPHTESRRLALPFASSSQHHIKRRRILPTHRKRRVESPCRLLLHLVFSPTTVRPPPADRSHVQSSLPQSFLPPPFLDFVLVPTWAAHLASHSPLPRPKPSFSLQSVPPSRIHGASKNPLSLHLDLKSCPPLTPPLVHPLPPPGQKLSLVRRRLPHHVVYPCHSTHPQSLRAPSMSMSLLYSLCLPQVSIKARHISEGERGQMRVYVSWPPCHRASLYVPVNGGITCQSTLKTFLISCPMCPRPGLSCSSDL